MMPPTSSEVLGLDPRGDPVLGGTLIGPPREDIFFVALWLTGSVEFIPASESIPGAHPMSTASTPPIPPIPPEPKASIPLGWIAGSVVLGVCLACPCGFGAGWWGKGRSSPTAPTTQVASNKTVGDLVEHFRKAGMDGRHSLKAAALIGAKDGCGFEGADFSVEIYLFDDQSRAESLEKTGFEGMKVHRRGKFVMLINIGEDKVLPVFQSF